MSANPKYRSCFKRVETDDELRARVFPAGSRYVVEHVPERQKGERPLAYRARVRRPGEADYQLDHRIKYGESVLIETLAGERLDDVVWRVYQVQRKIVEDVTT